MAKITPEVNKEYFNTTREDYKVICSHGTSDYITKDDSYGVKDTLLQLIFFKNINHRYFNFF